MNLAEINPHIRYARIHEFTHMRTMPSICYDCRLFYIKEGNGNIMIEGNTYPYSPNTAIFLPPQSHYQFFIEYSAPLQIMIFDFDLIHTYAHLKESFGTATEKSFDPARVLRYDLPEEFSKGMVMAAPQLYESLKKISRGFLTKKPYHRETGSAMLKWCLFELLRENASDQESPLIRAIMDYVHKNYQDPALTNEKIAKALHYHPYYISQRVKQSTGKTLNQYLQYYRIRMAKNLLITTDLDINTISWKCGFNSSAYFIKIFKQQTALTPKQFRKSQLELIF